MYLLSPLLLQLVVSKFLTNMKNSSTIISEKLKPISVDSLWARKHRSCETLDYPIFTYLIDLKIGFGL